MGLTTSYIIYHNKSSMFHNHTKMSSLSSSSSDGYVQLVIEVVSNTVKALEHTVVVLSNLEVGSSKWITQKFIQIHHDVAHLLMHNYYEEHTIHRFRIHKLLFMSIVEDVMRACLFFKQ